jgi:GNAT superfamily N-acetyltransferase
MPRILTDFSPPALVYAIEYNRIGHLIELYALLAAHAPEVAVHDTSDLKWVLSGMDSPYLNAVKLAHFDSDDLEAGVDSVLAPFEARGLPLSWWVGPASCPANLGAALEARGFTHEDTIPGMALDLDRWAASPPPPELRIERVDGPARQARYRRAFQRGFDLPDFFAEFFMKLYAAQGFALDAPRRYYLGLVDGEPVACSTLYLGAGVAGVYAVGTIPEWRGKGYGTALTTAPLQDARAFGYRVSILHASQTGLSVYRRMGFQTFCEFAVYVRGSSG